MRKNLGFQSMLLQTKNVNIVSEHLWTHTVR